MTNTKFQIMLLFDEDGNFSNVISFQNDVEVSGNFIFDKNGYFGNIIVS